ncbi:thiol-disulfide oxidoreductase ResA [Heyndrickxia sp. NPDC080065]|uniref:thiol-disulfide oxidoreductase ResA n=1 Tax=Heyndrickxia sp. NPDC080065 TaxID=3390568 RepID=UPI003CFF5E81
MKNKKKRLLIRTLILVLLFGMVGYTLYQNLTKDNKGKVTVGKTAPNFELETLKGESFQLSDFKGKAVLINFWGTWCEPCKREMPNIQAAFEKYHKQGFEVISIDDGVESKFIVNKFIKQYGLTFPISQDKKSKVNNTYKVYNLPASFFINRNGKVVRAFEGEMNKDQLEQWIGEIL